MSNMIQNDVNLLYQPRRKSSDKIMDIPNEIEELLNYEENSSQLLEKFEYPRNGNDSGLVIIFNQMSFVNNTERRGTNRDVNEIIQTFSRLGYNIRKEHVFNNLSRNEVLEELDKLATGNHSQRNCLIIFFLSHGSNNNILDASDGVITVEELWKRFGDKNSPTLAKKPKLFVIQSCKGVRDSDTEAIKGDIIPQQFFSNSLHPDMLIAFATVEGSTSIRHIQKGSWFIQELCKSFIAYGRRDDVFTMLIRTSKIIANFYYNEKIVEDRNLKMRIIAKQMPLLISTLSRKFYLTRSKERLFTLSLIEKTGIFREKMNEISKKIHVLYQACDEENRSTDKSK